MFSKKIQISFYIIVGLSLILFFRVWQLQILEGQNYRELAENNRLRILKIPAPRGIIYDRNGIPLVKNIPSFSVYLSTQNLNRIDINSLSELLGLKKEDLEEKLNRHENKFIPVKLKYNLTFEEVAKIEAKRSDFPGLFIETEGGREYPFGKLAAHVVGYLGRVTSSQLNNPSLRHFPPDALVGQWGAEALFDEELRGIPGERVIEVDALGRELRLLREKQPVKGKDIELSIDINVSKAVANAFGDRVGAFVAIKPDTGEILALESLPSFDPNVFSKGLKKDEWKSIVEDKRNPMLNRAVQSQYPPGSIFKIVTALAALEEGIIDPNTKINCTGGINYGKWRFGCWKKEGHGPVDLYKAIVVSCDVYFYEIGKRLGIDKIHKYAVDMGLGNETGIELMPIKEKKGLIPTVEWKKTKKNQPWYLGDTFISAIGQGFVTITPIQAALMTSTFSNGGHIHKPTILKNGFKEKEGALNSQTIEIKQEHVRFIKKALFDVVNSVDGTAKTAKSNIISIAGKTGTAQVVGKKKGLIGGRFSDHAWFVAFAPVDKPEIALSVFVEHGGSGGGAAAPIAKQAIEAYVISKKSQSSIAKIN